MNTRQEELSSQIKQYTLLLLISIKDYLHESFNIYRGMYGMLGVLAAVLVAAKTVVFYMLMGTSSHFVSVCIITLIFIYLIFKSTDNKWVPAVIFLVMSFLMFCDVTYSSFFNRYLSVGMIGAAEVVGDIGESIKEVMRPINFFMLADAVFIIVMLIFKKKSESLKKKPEDGDTGNNTDAAEKIVDSEEENIFAVFDALTEENREEAEAAEEDNEDAEIAETTEADTAETAETADHTDNEESGDSIVGTSYWESAGGGDFVLTEPATAEESEHMQSEEETERTENAADEIAKAVSDFFIKAAEALKPLCGKLKSAAKAAYKKAEAVTHPKAIAAFILIIIFTTTNVFGSGYITSIGNQEFFSFHIKDIFTGLAGDKTSENLAAWTKSYESEKDGPLFGAAKDKNLIIIQVESLQDFVIGREYNGQEITPNLNALISGNATYFDNFYQQVGSGNTSDAEFATNNSLYGTLVSYTYKLFNQNYFRGLPVQLSEMGYDTAVFHAHEDRTFWSRENMYPSEGFGRYYGGLKGRGGDYEMTEWMGWGLTDSEFYPQTVEYMKELSEPFYSFVISISNHHPYEMLNKYKFIDLEREDRDTIVGKYIQSAAYTDYALGVFFDELKEAGLYDNSIFVIYGDHTGLSHSEEIDEGMEKLLGKPYDYEEMLKIPLIIYSPDESIDLHDTIMTAGGETDIMPTVAYLMGIEELDTIYTGHNLYTCLLYTSRCV